MKLRTVALLLLFVLVALFVALNWSAFLTPTPLTVGFARFEAPLGLLMLSLTAVVVAALLLYILVQQASVILELRRSARELHSHRELADKAEASRFTELRTVLQADLLRMESKLDALQAGAASPRLLSKHDDVRDRTSGGTLDGRAS